MSLDAQYGQGCSEEEVTTLEDEIEMKANVVYVG